MGNKSALILYILAGICMLPYKKAGTLRTLLHQYDLLYWKSFGKELNHLRTVFIKINDYSNQLVNNAINNELQ